MEAFSVKPPISMNAIGKGLLASAGIAWTLALPPVLAAGSANPSAPPAARVAPVEDNYFGTRVTDPYRWMEEQNSAELKSWMKEQASYTRATLDRIGGRAALLARIHELDQAASDVYAISVAGNRYFYFRSDPSRSVPRIMVRDGFGAPEKLLFDPATLAPQQGGHAEAGWFQASDDGRYLAVGINYGGSEESGHLRVIDVDSGRLLDDDIPRVWSGGEGSASWLPDGLSFVYMQYPKLGPGEPATERMMRTRARLHTLGQRGDGEGDIAIFGFDVDPGIKLARENWNFVATAPGSEYAVAASATVDVDLAGLFVAPVAQLASGSVRWTRIAGPDDQILGGPRVALHGHDLYVVTRKGAPRFRVLRIDLAHPDLASAPVVVPEGDLPIEDVAAASDGLYVLDLDAGPSRLRRLAWGELEASTIALPFRGAIRFMTTHPQQPGALLRMRSRTRSNAILRVDAAAGAVTDTGWQEAARADFSGIEEREVRATGLDGTPIPLSILVRKGARLDGSHPAILESYGAYGVFGTAKPYFDPMTLAWLERGGVIAIAHPRGGGEFGEDWHRGGMKQTKLNTVFDTIACAQALVEAGYTRPSRLALYGASAGGIPAGGGLTWRPDLFGAVIDHAGVSDLLRMETTANGPANVPEFGSPRAADDFHAVYAASAYHHVHDGIAYPAVLLEAGVNDPRVDAWEMAKMAARLQAASSSGRPVLLRVDFDTGHFGGATQQEEALLADEWTFLLWQFGDPQFQPPPR